MIDLTPLDVRNKRGDFKKLMRGYDPDEVDVFLEIVAERLEGLVRENMQMRDRTQTLQQQVTSQLGREQAVQDALVTAQELRADIKAQSQREAEHVLREAQIEARRIIAEAEAEVRTKLRGAERRFDGVNDTLLELERRRDRFLKEFRQLLERELDVVEVEEARQPLEQRAIDLDLGSASAVFAAPPAAVPEPPPMPAVDRLPAEAPRFAGEDERAETVAAAGPSASEPDVTETRPVAGVVDDGWSPAEIDRGAGAGDPSPSRSDRAAAADVDVPAPHAAGAPDQVELRAPVDTTRPAAEQPSQARSPAVPPPLPKQRPDTRLAGSYEAEAVAEARSQVVEVRSIGPDALPEVPRLEEVLAEAGAELADLPEDLPAVPEGGEQIDPPRITERRDDKLLLYRDSDEPER